MNQFIVVDNLILDIYRRGTLVITPPEDAILKVTQSQFRFMEDFLPSGRLPIFELSIIEGNDRDRSTWKYLYRWNHCFINLLTEQSLKQWREEHLFVSLSRDEPGCYNLPIKLII